VKQFASCLDSVPEEIDLLYRKLRPKGRKPDFDQLCTVLIALTSRFLFNFVLLDGLDECRDKELSSILTLLRAISIERFQIYLTSRPQVKINHFFQDGGVLRTEIPILADDLDVKAYLTHRVSQSASFSPRFKEIVVETVAAKTQGL